MNKLQRGIANLHEIDLESAKRRSRTQVNPLARLVVTIVFICLTLSFGKLDVYGIAGMVIYIVVQSIIDEISLIKGGKRFLPVLVVLLIVGISNGIIDYYVGNDGSLWAMIVLLEKGTLVVCASYILFIQVGMEGICQALATIHVPNILVMMLVLNYRYIIVIMKEIERMLDAYKLRAGKQKGIHIGAWGSFAGLLLIRCIERAKNVYNAMIIRGYDEQMKCYRGLYEYSIGLSIIYSIIWIAILLGLRIFPIFTIIGNVVV